MSTDKFLSYTINDLHDGGAGTSLQQLEVLTWIIFLKVYQNHEQHWEDRYAQYHSVIPSKYQWNNWVNKDDLTGPKLLKFINKGLIPTLSKVKVGPKAPMYKKIIPIIFRNVRNYVTNGIDLKKVVNRVNTFNLEDNSSQLYKTGNGPVTKIYEQLLHRMQGEHSSDEFYTPRPLTNFVTRHLDIKLGKSIADFAVGTGGFLVSALEILHKEIHNTEDVRTYSRSVYGKELQPLPYLLCLTNLLLHDVDYPQVRLGDSLIGKEAMHPNKKYDRIAMNPPYKRTANNYNNFSPKLQSHEMAYLFLILAVTHLNIGGKAGLIMPEYFMFNINRKGTGIKPYFFKHVNVKYIIRLPKGVFSPYTSINTNVVFFDKDGGSTKKIWFYRLDTPKGLKHFTKTHPIQTKDFKQVDKWMKHPHTIKNNGNVKAEAVTMDQIKKNHYNLNPYARFGRKIITVKDPIKLLNEYLPKEARYHQQIQQLAKKVRTILQSHDKQ